MAIKSELKTKTAWDFFGKKKTVFVESPIVEQSDESTADWELYKGPKFTGMLPPEVPKLALYNQAARLNGAACSLIDDYEVTHVTVAVSPCRQKIKIMPAMPGARGALRAASDGTSKKSLCFSSRGVTQEFNLGHLIGKSGKVTLCDDGLIADFTDSL